MLHIATILIAFIFKIFSIYKYLIYITLKFEEKKFKDILL